MSKKIVTNVSFIILILLLLIVSAVKNQPADVGFGNFGGLMDILNHSGQTEIVEEAEVVNEFEHMQDVKKVDKTIDISTAREYLKEIPLSGTQMLALTKVKKISPYLNTNKKVIIYVTSGHGDDIESFLREFANTRNYFANSSDVVFIPRESIWTLKEENIKNSHDRVIYNLQKDCGLFCVIIPNQEKMVRLKGSNVNKKTAQIMHVYLTH